MIPINPSFLFLVWRFGGLQTRCGFVADKEVGGKAATGGIIGNHPYWMALTKAKPYSVTNHTYLVYTITVSMT